ncbi:MAG: glycosyltransferase family 4 protein [Bacteroidetes bacterium]|nr:glycosyltransferase family 4 protein [Bacteroidota bacterium]
MKKNVTYIISDIDKAISFEWVAQYLNKDKFNLSFILINCKNSQLYSFLFQNNFQVFLIDCASKKQIPFSVLKCAKVLKNSNPHIVHCHLFMANIIGLTAAKLARVKSRIYTRHHSDYHHIYFPKTVKWDKYCNKLATKIISISDNVTDILIEKENVSKNKIVKIWHGFDIDLFVNFNKEKVEDLKRKYNSQQKKPVVGVISRFTHWKGVQYIIPAYKKLLEKYPNALLLLFNAKGDYEKEITNLLLEIPEQSYQTIKFENDITNLYQLFDVFVHVPISNSVEAFGQIYIETMLAGVPLIATRSGVGNEIMQNKINCIEVPYQNSEAIYNAMLFCLENRDPVNMMVKNAKESVIEKFSLHTMIQNLEKLYLL